MAKEDTHAIKEMSFVKTRKKEYDPSQDLLIMSSLRYKPKHGAVSKSEESLKGKLPSFLADTYGKIEDLNNQLQTIVSSLEGKLDAAIQKDEGDFLAAYRAHLQKIQNELSLYRSKLNEQELLAKKDAALISLTQSLNYFKNESLRLAGKVEEQKREITRLEVNVEMLEKDNEFYKSKLKKSRKQNKLLSVSIDRAKNLLYSNPKDPYDMGQANRGRNDSKEKCTIDTHSKERMTTISTVEEETKELNYDVEFDSFAKTLENMNLSKTNLIAQCQTYVQALVRKRDETEANLKQLLVSEKKANQKLRLASKSVSSRTELERLFCECAEEVRNKVAETRRRNGPPCLVTEYHHGNGAKGDDKVAVMERFMSNEKLLAALYDLVFDKNKAGVEAEVLPKFLDSERRLRRSITAGNIQKVRGLGRNSGENLAHPLSHREMQSFIQKKKVQSGNRNSTPAKYFVKNGKLLILSKE